jgi:hypothetical protein
MWSIGNEVDYPNDPYTHPVLADEGISQQSVRKFLEDHPRAELQLNGKTVGEGKQYDTETGIIAWILNYEPGELKVIAFNNGNEAATYKITSNTMPAKIDAEVLKPTDNELSRQVKVQILDENGNHSILADNEITCEITGGTLPGMENASTNVAENYQDNRQRCINGKLLIYVKKGEGENPVSLKLSSPLLETTELNIE